MNKIFIFIPILCLFISLNTLAKDFENDARDLVKSLKMSLSEKLSSKIKNDGVKVAIPFCKMNVKEIAKQAAKDYIAAYKFGRTSHKIRNQENAPATWMDNYLNQFKNKTIKDNLPSEIVHKLDDNKKAYLSPLYVEAKCLTCHGENVSTEVKGEIDKLYPKDNATGFKLGDFRGFIWVVEK